MAGNQGAAQTISLLKKPQKGTIMLIGEQMADERYLFGLELVGGQTGHKREDGGHTTINWKNKRAKELVALFISMLIFAA